MKVRNFAKTIMTNFSYGVQEISTDIDLDQASEILNCMIDIKEKPEGFVPKLNTMDLKSLGLNERADFVLLLTGGLDSTLAYFRLLDEGYKSIFPIYVDFGHPYAEKEIKALHKLKIDFFYYKEIVPVRYDGPWEHIIPARNLYLLGIASEIARDGGEIWISSVAGETPEYGGDKSLTFYKQAHDLIKTTSGKDISIKCMNERTKSGWVSWFLNECLMDELTYEDKVGILKTTVSCFSGHSHLNCGKCRACLRKWICLTYNDVDCDDMFEVHPYHGAGELVQEYKDRMSVALQNSDFSYFTKNRCKETLSVFKRFEDGLLS